MPHDYHALFERLSIWIIPESDDCDYELKRIRRDESTKKEKFFPFRKSLSSVLDIIRIFEEKEWLNILFNLKENYGNKN